MPTLCYKNPLRLPLDFVSYFVLSLPPNPSISHLQVASGTHSFGSSASGMCEILHSSGFEAPSKHAVFLKHIAVWSAALYLEAVLLLTQ